jgi:hypothetical protein
MEDDGWGKMCMRISLGSTDVGFFAHVSTGTLAAAVDTSKPMKELTIEKDWEFLFNVCDIFRTATEALSNANTST